MEKMNVTFVTVRQLLQALRFGYDVSQFGPSETSGPSMAIGRKEAKRILIDKVCRVIGSMKTPVVALVSGGVDSTFMYHMARRCWEDKDILTLSMGHLPLVGRMILPRKEWVGETLDLINGNTYRDLFFSSSLIVTRALFREAREMGAASILTGDGGDELFCGYDRYLLPGIKSDMLRSRRGQKAANYFLTGYEGTLTLPLDMSLATGFPYLTSKEGRMEYDISGELRHVEIPKVQTAARMAQVEGLVRSPFLVPDVFNFCAALPLKFKYQCGVRKVLLREILKDEGVTVPHRKVGFAVPDGWIRNELEWSLMVLSRLMDQGLVRVVPG